MLTNADLAQLFDLRRDLHRQPELSGAEYATAARIAAELRALGADRVATRLGGTGVVGVFDSGQPGPRLMFRAELDGLPIREAEGPAHRSQTDGRGHLCGHDGHMAVLLGLGRVLARRRPARGSVTLLFQPAEETGEGAAAMLDDPRFAPFGFDWGFALHNYPGLPRDQALLAAGPVNCASVGLLARLTGATAHASEPEKARSPAAALGSLVADLTGLGGGGPLDDHYRLVTITHLRMGEPAFGITPGEGEIWATLRARLDPGLAELRQRAEATIRAAAAEHGLTPEISWHDGFAASVNDAEAAAHLQAAAEACGVRISSEGLPMRGSEDFGRFGAAGRTAMMFLGAGADHPGLHAADYDFPDELIEQGARIFLAVIERLSGIAAPSRG